MRMYEVDFLPMEETGDLGSKSGDAITLRFTEALTATARVVVIDGGYKKTGDRVVEHIQRYYQTDHVDLIISTHPDQDHINGLASVLTELSVGELLIHVPQDHADDATDFSNIEVVDALVGLAEDKGVPVTEPFTGLTRFGGQLRVLGPTQALYEELLAQHLEEMRSGTAAALSRPVGSGLLSKAADLLDRTLASLPFETLGENGDTGPRNESSVITLVRAEGHHMLFTGDAGIRALNAGCDEFENQVGPLPSTLVGFFQAPHHGSKRNLAPSLLNRIYGSPGSNTAGGTSFISSAHKDTKHPSPKVTNALARRGLSAYATEGQKIWHNQGAPPRSDFSPLAPIGPLDENDD
jgi:beta-lactamase superfamily II metal-dependent hydrolase